MENNQIDIVDTGNVWKVGSAIWFDTGFVLMDTFATFSLHVAREVAMETNQIIVRGEFVFTFLFAVLLRSGAIVVGLSIGVVSAIIIAIVDVVAIVVVTFVAIVAVLRSSVVAVVVITIVTVVTIVSAVVAVVTVEVGVQWTSRTNGVIWISAFFDLSDVCSC